MSFFRISIQYLFKSSIRFFPFLVVTFWLLAKITSLKSTNWNEFMHITQNVVSMVLLKLRFYPFSFRSVVNTSEKLYCECMRALFSVNLWCACVYYTQTVLCNKIMGCESEYKLPIAIYPLCAGSAFVVLLCDVVERIKHFICSTRCFLFGGCIFMFENSKLNHMITFTSCV